MSIDMVVVVHPSLRQFTITVDAIGEVETHPNMVLNMSSGN